MNCGNHGSNGQVQDRFLEGWRIMENRFSKISLPKWVYVSVLLGFCIVLYSFNLGRWDLWGSDEPRYAQIAREMVQGGDWVLMHYNGKIYSDKPPLFFWLIAFSSSLCQEFSSFSVRFPSALFGILTIFLTFLIGTSLYSARSGFLSGLILATSFEFFFRSIRANMDTTLTFFTTASMLCFLKWYRYRKEDGKGAKEGGTLFVYGFYVTAALATLTKGPVGFIIPLLIALTYLSAKKDWQSLKEMKLLPGMLLMIGIVLCWYLPAGLKAGEDYLHATLYQHSVARFAKGSAHVHPIHYYLINFPRHFLPWVLFLPAAIVYGYSKEVIGKRKDFFFLLAWFIVTFLFFSLAKGKRGLYLLPLFPAVSLMIGKLWDDLISFQINHFKRAWIFVPLCVLMGLTFVAAGALPWVVSIKFRPYLFHSFLISFFIIGSSLVLFFLYRFKNYGAIFLLIVAMTGAGYFFTTRVIFPLVNPQRSARFTCQEITSRLKPGEKIAAYGDFETGPYNYYTGIIPILELDGERSLSNFLGSSERVFCLLRFKELVKIQNREGFPKVYLISQQNGKPKDIALISNR
jgi:4-amino-4-deoxy-L-arabinose transferase-like glycosyltransferase